MGRSPGSPGDQAEHSRAQDQKELDIKALESILNKASETTEVTVPNNKKNSQETTANSCEKGTIYPLEATQLAVAQPEQAKQRCWQHP